MNKRHKSWDSDEDKKLQDVFEDLSLRQKFLKLWRIAKTSPSKLPSTETEALRLWKGQRHPTHCVIEMNLCRQSLDHRFTFAIRRKDLKKLDEAKPDLNFGKIGGENSETIFNWSECEPMAMYHSRRVVNLQLEEGDGCKAIESWLAEHAGPDNDEDDQEEDEDWSDFDGWP